MNALLQKAQQLDDQDELKLFREAFCIPRFENGDQIYFCGNSLGLQPKAASMGVQKVMQQWASRGVYGHFDPDNPWLELPDKVAELNLPLLGAKHHEVTLMNALTVNIHLMLASFYQPTKKRYKILIEDKIFPSDYYALQSHCVRLGLDPAKTIIELPSNNDLYSVEQVETVLKQQGDSIALVFLPGVQYVTGQVFDIATITRLAQSHGCIVGWDLAHAVGNIELNLNHSQTDFAVWCNYKYMNAGPGAVSGVFVHEKHLNKDLPRLQGWWGLSSQKRFDMDKQFKPDHHAKSWQISNPPILSLAILYESLKIFNQANMLKVRAKAQKMWDFTCECIQAELKDTSIVTPVGEHGCQFSLKLHDTNGIDLLQKLYAQGCVADWRGQDILRFAPVPLYNTFSECYRFVSHLKIALQGKR